MRSLAIYRKNEDLINIGAYVKGSDAEVDVAIKRHSALDKLLVQGMTENSKYENTEAAMKEIAAMVI
jgi:flagellum-specific ATP synthase